MLFPTTQDSIVRLFPSMLPIKGCTASGSVMWEVNLPSRLVQGGREVGRRLICGCCIERCRSPWEGRRSSSTDLSVGGRRGNLLIASA